MPITTGTLYFERENAFQVCLLWRDVKLVYKQVTFSLLLTHYSTSSRSRTSSNGYIHLLSIVACGARLCHDVPSRKIIRVMKHCVSSSGGQNLTNLAELYSLQYSTVQSAVQYSTVQISWSGPGRVPLRPLEPGGLVHQHLLHLLDHTQVFKRFYRIIFD